MPLTSEPSQKSESLPVDYQRLFTPYAVMPEPDGRHDLDTFLPGEIVAVLKDQGGSLALNYMGSQSQWVAGCVFGSETEGSDMAAGAAYGMGVTPEDALIGVARDLGRK